jgi:branched-chain amino acid transport system ATP-binding protein
VSLTPAVLEVRDLQTAYGLSRVLFGVSIEVHAGECVCLIGRNGVGKTTTMRSIMGLTPPQAGRVVWKSTDITGCRRTGWPAPAWASCRRTVEYSPT